MMSTPKLLVIRHAESDLAGTFCGHLDPPLSPPGHAQLDILLERLAQYSIDALYTSDLRRALSTAEAISMKFGVVSIRRPMLRELYFGEWEGRTWEQVQQKDPIFAQKWVDAFPHITIPEGEDYRSFQTRVLGEVDHLLSSSSLSHRTAVVTHAGVMRVILQDLCGVSVHKSWDFTKEYCSFFEYPYTSTREADPACL